MHCLVRLREIYSVVVETVNNEFHSYCNEAFLLTSPPPLGAYEQHDGAQTVGIPGHFTSTAVINFPEDKFPSYIARLIFSEKD
jgi:hypothetical protein